MDSERLANKLAKVISKKVGEHILILDVRGTAPFADFLVLATANSTVHARAIADALLNDRSNSRIDKPHHIEGLESCQWILIDYIDVIVHIFLPEVREFYGLERLWGDVPRWAIEEKESK